MFSLLESLNHIRKELQQEAHSLARISDEYGKVLKREQIAALLLSVEKVYIINNNNKKINSNRIQLEIYLVQ